MALVLLGILLSAACGGTLEVGVEPTTGMGAVRTATPAPSAHASSTPASVQTAQTSGLLCLNTDDGTLALWSAHGEPSAALGRLPEDAAHLTLGPRHLAYVTASCIEVLSLSNGATRSLVDLPASRLDLALRWSFDGSALAYAVAWDAPDGSRVVELSVSDGYEYRLVDRAIARLSSPESDESFARLWPLGFDRVAGRLTVIPVGGEERFTWVRIHHTRTGERVRTVSIPLGLGLPANAEVHEVALAPDGARLAVAYWIPMGEGRAEAAVSILDLDVGSGLAGAALPPETHAASLHWSPDGTELAYLVRAGRVSGLAITPSVGLRLLDAATGDERRLRLTVSPEAALHGWTADGAAVVLEALDGIERRLTVSLVDADGGDTTAIPIPPGIRPIGWVGPLPD